MYTVQSTIDDLGMPRPWSTLIRKPINRDLECTAKILADINKPKVQDYLAQLARRELWYVSAFLNSLQIPFFFVAWDHQRSVVVRSFAAFGRRNGELPGN